MTVTMSANALASCCADLYELPIVEYLLGQSFHPGGTKLTRQLANSALVSRKSSVLDVACGNGTSARRIAADFGASVTGCDYSELNLKRAVTSTSAGQLEHQTRFVRGSAEKLPFAAESFDVALCECSLCLFDDRSTALAEMHRVLKPGGRIAISDFFLEAPVPKSLDNLLGRILCVAAAPSVAGYRDSLARAGFEFIRIRNVNWTLAEMIKRIRNRLGVLAATTAAVETMLPADWGDVAPVLADLERFIAGGAAGYLMATARRNCRSRDS